MQEVQQQQSQIEAQNSHRQIQTKDFTNHFPAVQISSKHYSLDADIATGWKPKVKILGPIPLNFDSKLTDQIIDQLTSFGRKYKERVVYLGYRYQSSFKLHQQIRRQYDFKYEGVINSNYLHMAAYFRKFHSNFKSKATRIFKGMNPTIPKDQQLVFDSNFQGGNLDASVKINQIQYDLFMRADSNTRGHMQWFNFTIKNCGKKRIKLNIVNFKKSKTMYSRGMKPYISSSFLNQTTQCGWIQGCQNVKYQRRRLTYPFLLDYFTQQQLNFYCLTFTYEFNTDWQEVHFAYAPPFTYSDNLLMIRDLKTMNKTLMKQNHTNQNYLKEQLLTESLSGLEIQLLTITDTSIQNKKKRCVLLSGRIHPGEPCGSYMMKGFLNFLLSQKEQAKYLREHLVFKVVPMINPDGVVAGNFRTSLCGKDLNRTFKLSNQLLIPQVRGLKELVTKLKQQWKNRLIMFFDFHGHSLKKNVFLYGPQYQIWQAGYYKTRIFPKLLSDSTQMFRYYSCLFRIAEFKKTTARAVILRNIPHCYTVQASTGFYYSQEEKKDLPFTTQKYEFMGQKIAKTLKDYIHLLYDQQQSRLQRKQKMSQLRMIKSNRAKSKKESERQSTNKTKFQSRKVQNPCLLSGKQQDESGDRAQMSCMSQKAREMIEKIKKDEDENKGIGEGHQSDEFEEGGSDSQSESDDLNQQELDKLHADIIQSMKEFRQKIGEKDLLNNRQFSFKQQPKKKTSLKEPHKPKLQLIASLRNRFQRLEHAKPKSTKEPAKRPIRQDLRLDKIKRASVNPQKDKPNPIPSFIPKPIKSSIARLYEPEHQEQTDNNNILYQQNNILQQQNKEQQQGQQSTISSNLNKVQPNQLASVTKSRLYSLIERHQNEGFDFIDTQKNQYISRLNPQIHQNFNTVSQLLHHQRFVKNHQDKLAATNDQTVQLNDQNFNVNYASHITERSLPSKLKRVFQSHSSNNLLQNSNFITSSTIIEKHGLNIIKYGSQHLNR